MANPLYGQNKFDNAIDNSTGQVVSVIPSADGTEISGAETVVLTATDAGNKYFVNIGANTATFRLPSAYTSKGYEVSITLDIGSNSEAAKDCTVFTDSTAEFIIGAGNDAGVVHLTDVDNDELMFDGTKLAGDNVSLICDGHHWYANYIASTAAVFVSGTATRS
tara:strand:- start:3880 stop:4371 length:492 start_codon:yes stop_codon:yes gene_type:complete